MEQRMNEHEVRRFMVTGSRTGKLATVRTDGRPHIAPVWFSFDDLGRAVFLTAETSLKARNMRQDPRVSLLVDLEEMPFGWARFDGVASFSDDAEELLRWATETSRRYVGEARADEFGRRNGVAGEVVVFIEPTRLVGEVGVAD